MDFGLVGLDGLVGSETGLASLTTSDPETKQKLYGSGYLKQERSENTSEDDWRRSLKLAKTDDFSVSKAMLIQQQHHQQMLSFSSPKSESLLHRYDSTAATFPCYQHHTQSACNRNTGYNCGSLNAATMHGLLTGVRGPFTPSQWMELEHQALIYKYINANVPIPSNLLIPIKKALDSVGFSTFSGLPFRPNAFGWGSFHLGFSNNTDPEPGRCRRTDGKKWRCSRDAVADQKYCERHINRGRHRSRKPVEGQSGHSVAGTTTTTTTTTKLMSIASSSPSVVSGGDNGTPYSLAMTHQQQVKHLQPSASDTSAAAQINKMFVNKQNLEERMRETPLLSMLSSNTNVNVNSKNSLFSIPEQRVPYEESSQSEFGLVSADCLLNPSNKSFTFMSCKNYNSSKDLTAREAESQHPLRHFMDDWPQKQSDRSTISWRDMSMQSDGTQLSISIPMAPSDFMSSTSSPTNENPAAPPLRLSRELDPIQMGLGVGSVSNEQNQRQTNWIPISWETSVGGPLGEVLHNTNINQADCKNSSALNLMTEGWENSPRIGSSPTGVLQKTTFGSLSNSSAGSSPRAENSNRTHEGSSFCNVPHLVQLLSIPRPSLPRKHLDTTN